MKTFKNYIKEGMGHNAVEEFASKQHEVWRKGFDPEGSGKQRIKKNSDGSEGNINVPFKELHPDWQKENLAAGKAALQAIRKHPNDMEAAAEHVHNEWMKRNPKADYNAAQHVPYSELPEEEKQKDRDHVDTMKSILGKKPTNESTAVRRTPWAGGKSVLRRRMFNVAGHAIKMDDVTYRGADGYIHRGPPGKSRSSER